MSWHDRVRDGVGSFRGVRFHVARHSAERGRRVEVHEYPLRDEPYAEDLGRRARRFIIECFLLGEDYDRARDRLIEAVERPGAGELVHPYYGRRRVVVTDFRVRESTRDGGEAQVTLSVVEAADRPRLPETRGDTRVRAGAALAQAEAGILSDLGEDYDLAGLAADQVAQVERDVAAVLGDVESAIGGLTKDVAEVIHGQASPASLGAMVLDSLHAVADAVTEPFQALGIYEALWTRDAGDEMGGPSDPGPFAPQGTQRVIRSRRAFRRFTRQAAALDAARAAVALDYDNAGAAERMLEAVTDGLTRAAADGQEAAGQDVRAESYARIVGARARVTEDLRARAAALPELMTWTTGATLPALVIAQRLYGDARREAEIVSRNNLRHPGAVAGGSDLEVLVGGEVLVEGSAR